MWAFLIASTILFKWYDDKGNLHVTDRLASVPQKYRAKFAKQAEEAEKKKKASPPRAEPAPAPTYERYLARLALERATREKSARLREQLTEARKKVTTLEEEYGVLASNPVMNAAVPARRERMEEIQAEIGKANSRDSRCVDHGGVV
jgi:hypothetical protein